MARTKDLAGLAALGALGYMLTKGKDQTTDQTPGLGRQSLGAGYDSTETREEPRRQITDYMATAPQDPREAGSEVASASSDVLASKPKLSSAAPKSRGVSLPSGIMGGARQADATSLPSGIMGGARQADSSTPTQSTAKRETYRGMDGKIRYKEPSGPSASQMASDAISSGAKKVGSGIADYVSNFETPAERRSRLSKQPAGMKRGGTVKMASGGVTSSASRRADGIATKGKTRGKIC